MNWRKMGSNISWYPCKRRKKKEAQGPYCWEERVLTTTKQGRGKLCYCL